MYVRLLRRANDERGVKLGDLPNRASQALTMPLLIFLSIGAMLDHCCECFRVP